LIAYFKEAEDESCLIAVAGVLCIKPGQLSENLALFTCHSDSLKFPTALSSSFDLPVFRLSKLKLGFRTL
jgi:hypothetical protein